MTSVNTEIKPVAIGESLLGAGQQVYVIGEIGINHNGDIEIAKQRTNGFLTGIEVGVLLFETANPLYKFKIEGHLAFRFSDTPLIPALKGYTVGTRATQNR